MSFSDLDLHRAVADLQATARERDKLLDVQNERATAIRDWTDRRLSTAESHIFTLHETVMRVQYKQEKNSICLTDHKRRIDALESNDRWLKIATLVIPPLLFLLALAYKIDPKVAAGLIGGG